MTDLMHTPETHPGGPVAWAKEMLFFPEHAVSGKQIRDWARRILLEAGIDPRSVARPGYSGGGAARRRRRRL